MSPRTTLELAVQKIREYTTKIEIVKFSGTSTGRSVFLDKNRGLVFSSSLHTVLKTLKKGAIPGVRQTSPVFEYEVLEPSLEDQLKEWLRVNEPGISLVSMGPTYGDKATFLRKDTQTLHELEPNRLKDKHRRGLFLFPTTEEVQARRRRTREEKGHNVLVQGKPLAYWAQRQGVGYSTFQSAVKHRGVEAAMELRSGVSSLETAMQGLLESLGVEYVYNKRLPKSSLRPDFFLPKHNLVIECDGLYWHSDLFKDASYHVERRQEFVNQGVTPLFFRENEINNSFDAVRGMIRHRCGLIDRRVGARQLSVQETTKKFFAENHLMGAGRGPCWGLFLGNECLAALQIVRKKDSLYEVSRFCVLPGVSVAGGFSKLMSFLLKEYEIEELISYVDLRYGTGTFLEDLGFTLVNKPRPSFVWVKDHEVAHRMRFPGKSGYEHGWQRLWDCGQALYKYVETRGS